VDGRDKPGHDEVKVSANLTLRIGVSGFMRRVKGLSKRFESCRHALAFDFFFARVHDTLWHDRQWQRVLLIAP